MFDEPYETGRTLNSDQGKAVDGVKGDCGLVAVENVARLAGKDITEADVVCLAVDEGLCESESSNPAENGGTSVVGLYELLDKMGIRPAFAYTTVDNMADQVESGRGVIAVVNTAEFWDGYPYDGMHAVTVTSVERDGTGAPRAFYVCDSGTGGSDASRRVDASRMAGSLWPGEPLVVTERPIR